eukprot:TRINITY_DN516_c0_g1_i1.p1 TRINITY_DN516_c0_g1~~TRINITY_DN516_c0_g1_i1.p1  ORF type:complete len:124 (-),score=5.82 TRINITY_DN516_c0_g1_i1:54-425(-)
MLTDTLSFRLLFEETTNVYGHVKKLVTRFESCSRVRRQQQAYTEEELAYIETQNNLDIYFEVVGTVLMVWFWSITSVTIRSFDFSDLVTYLCSIGSTLFAHLASFFKLSSKRYNAFYPASKKS